MIYVSSFVCLFQDIAINSNFFLFPLILFRLRLMAPSSRSVYININHDHGLTKCAKTLFASDIFWVFFLFAYGIATSKLISLPPFIWMMGLNSGGRTSNRHKTIHSNSIFARIKYLANSTCLTKKSFLLSTFLWSSRSFPQAMAVKYASSVILHYVSMNYSLALFMQINKSKTPRTMLLLTLLPREATRRTSTIIK
jgi:hypothetical protein